MAVYADIVLNLTGVADGHMGVHIDILPILHPDPMTAEPMTWQKCQMCVPSPMRAPSSMMLLGWMSVPRCTPDCVIMNTGQVVRLPSGIVRLAEL